MNRFNSPTRIEFDNSAEAKVYVTLIKRAMGPAFVVEQNENVVTLKRPVVSPIHEQCFRLAKETSAVAAKLDAVRRSGPQVGDRVYAVRDEDDDNVYLFGFGTLLGDEIPDSHAAGFAAPLREAGTPNPKIQLDDGTIVWGCECWWGPEELFPKQFKKNVVKVDIGLGRMEQHNELN